jgi:hypothetical protein
MDNAANMATPHLLMKLDRQNIAKTSFKLPASDSCGDDCAAECPVNGQKVLVVTVYVSPNTPSDDWKSLIFSTLAGYSPKVCKMLKFLARRSCEDMTIILAGDFNVNVKDNYNAELVRAFVALGFYQCNGIIFFMDLNFPLNVPYINASFHYMGPRISCLFIVAKSVLSIPF